MFVTKSLKAHVARLTEEVSALERRSYNFVETSDIAPIYDRLRFLEAEIERLTKQRKPCGTCGHREKVR